MEDPKNPKIIDEQVLTNLSEALGRITDLVSKTLKEDRYYPGFRGDMLDIRQRVDKIVHVLHEGNGEKPLVTRVALAEAAVMELQKDFYELKQSNKISNTSNEVLASSAITMRGYVLVGLTSSVTAIIVGIIQKLL